ncbi:MAG: phage tail tape measure protein, partial [Lentisphaeria bacterium]|nr:phage tail tape measure protein [Lentisphaeria bacterium]
SGVGIDEQMAVLGTLQATMGGESAGTAYKAMLVNITKAGKVLNLNFTDAQGRMLPIVEILDMIKAKTGDANLKTADAAALVSAFGKQGAAAVMNLLSKTGELKGSIDELNAVQSSLNADGMAEKMVDPLDKFRSNLQNLKIVFGQAVLPVVNGLLQVVTPLIRFFAWSLDLFPFLRWHLTAFIGLLFALVAGLAALKIILAIRNMVRTLRIAWDVLNHSQYAGLILKVKDVALWIAEKTVMLAGKSATLACALAQKVMSLSLWHTTAAQWGLNTALLACPITWIVIAVAALVAELVLLVVYWDEITAALRKFYDACGPFAPLVRTVMRTLLGPIFAVADAIMSLGDAWNDLQSFFDRVADYATRIFTGLGEFFSSWWEGIVSPIRKVWEFFSGASGETVAGVNSAEPVLPASAGRGRNADVPAGGVRSSTVNRTTNYGGVTINTSSAPRAGELEEWVLLAGG